MVVEIVVRILFSTFKCAMLDIITLSSFVSNAPETKSRLQCQMHQIVTQINHVMEQYTFQTKTTQRVVRDFLIIIFPKDVVLLFGLSVLKRAESYNTNAIFFIVFLKSSGKIGVFSKNLIVFNFIVNRRT